MDHHKTLYKDQRSHTPRHHSRINRKLQEDNRAKNRRDRFQNSRNINFSPDQRVKEKLIPICVGNKENVNGLDPNTTRLAKIVSNTTNPEKLTKQEAFIKRFIEWKETKKNVKNSPKKKPFLSCASNSRQTANSSSLVPKGHHKGFRPPDGLKCADKIYKVEENKNPSKTKGRQSVYTLVPTPPKKQISDKSTNKFPNLKKSPSSSTAKNVVLKMTKTIEKSKSKTIAPQQIVKKEIKPRALKMPPPPSLPISIASKKPKGAIAKALDQKSTDKTKSTKKSTPPPPIRRPISTAAKKPVGAVPKIRNLAQKNANNVKPTKKSPLKSAPRLAQTLKAKKPSNNKKGNLTVLKVNAKKLVSMIKSNETDENMVIQTPRDFTTLNPFSEFVTSTKVKDSSQNIQIEGISPIEPSPKKMPNNSSAKRNILLKQADPVDRKTIGNVSHQNIKRFNFLRYSETKNTAENCEMNENEKFVVTDENDKAEVDTSAIADKTPTKTGPEERPPNYLSPFVSVTRGKVSLKKEKEKRNSVYLQTTNTTESHDPPPEVDKPKSPKYSVEVRRTLEAVRYFRKQLQDEIDRLHKLCDIWEAYKVDNLEKIQNANGEDMINVTIGQTRLLTSKKFMQFKGLIDRCEAGATGIGNVEYDGSENTKPITSVDLEGFWSMLGLQVDNLDKRFENLNRWKGNEWMDPEEVKPKKKNNLTKVKKPKAAPAAKAKPNAALQQMLRKMQVEMRKNNKNKNDDMNEIVVLTSSKQKHRRSASSNNSTPSKSLNPNESQRLSITVKDRKYFSPVATVISFSSSSRRASLRRKSSHESPKSKKHLQMLNNDLDNLQDTLGLRKSVLMNENSKRMSLNSMSPKRKNVSENPSNSMDVIKKRNDESPEENRKDTSTQKCFTPPSLYDTPVQTARKSILKTPGTAKSRLRNVIFNEKLRVKKFNFLINDNDANEEANDTHEEDLAKCCEDETLPGKKSPERTLTLRNRKVHLRPSCEILIPKN